MNDCIIISVDYDEFRPETYRGVLVTGLSVNVCFNSGDYDNADYFNAVVFAEGLGGQVVYDASVENFETDCYAAQYVPKTRNEPILA